MEFEMRDSPPPYGSREPIRIRNDTTTNVIPQPRMLNQDENCNADNMSSSNKDESSNASTSVHDSSHRVEGEKKEPTLYQSFNDANANATAAANQMEDHAALFVMLYLLFIFGLIVIAILIGLFVVIQYGFVVLVAVCAAVFGMLIVAVTLMSVITRDAKLSQARGKIKSWHVMCKEEILQEIENFKEDLYAYKHGMLLLTYDENYVDEIGVSANNNMNNINPDFESNDAINKASTDDTKERKPKSILFRFAVAPFIKSKKKKRGSNNEASQGKKKRKLWSRNKKKSNKTGGVEGAETSEYRPPSLEGGSVV